MATSPVYKTAPLGPVRQPAFLNQVLLAWCPLAPTELLRLLRRIERQAGRRPGGRWGPRPLDIDILMHGAQIRGWPPAHHRAGLLILPHPELHRRLFVVRPLADVAPSWRHPVLGLMARRLLGRLPLAPLARARQITPIPARA